jgi:hypothetical protein
MGSKVALSLALAASLLATVASSAQSDDDEQRLKQSQEILNKVGIALMAWWVDHAGTDPGDPWERWQPLDWSECPALSHGEAQALLIPRYLAEVPEEDAWGNPLELCLRRDTWRPPITWPRSAARAATGFSMGPSTSPAASRASSSTATSSGPTASSSPSSRVRTTRPQSIGLETFPWGYPPQGPEPDREGRSPVATFVGARRPTPLPSLSPIMLYNRRACRWNSRNLGGSRHGYPLRAGSP